MTWPSGEGIRVDAGVEQGSEVTSHYDPMLAKIIAYGSDRRQAVENQRSDLGSRKRRLSGAGSRLPSLEHRA